MIEFDRNVSAEEHARALLERMEFPAADMSAGDLVELANLIRDNNRLRSRLEEAVSAIRAVIHDRPTAHSDAVWQRMLTIIDKYEEFTDASR